MSASLFARGVTVVRGARTILDRVDVSVVPGRRTGLVGPNGVGKSTLLGVFAGVVAPDKGTVTAAPPTANIGLLVQEAERSDDESVHELLRRRAGVTAAQARLDAATQALAASAPGAGDMYSIALERWLAIGATDFEARIGEVWHALDLPERLLEQPTSSLSGGEAARTSLAALQLSRFDVYLLDEPTNDLDLDGLDLLEAWVLEQRAGMMLVSHDRRFLDRVVTHVVELDEFTHRTAEYAGGWQAYVDERALAREHAWERFDDYDTKRKALAGRAQRQREWASQGSARVKRSYESEPDKSIRAFRKNQTEQLAAKAAQTERAIERLEVADKPREPWHLRLEVANVGRSGQIVSHLSNAVVERDGFQLGPIDLLLEYGERVAIVGHNGSGKTTLIDLILGRREPQSGTAKLGAGVRIGEVEQARHQLADDAVLQRAMQDATGLTVSDVRTLLAKFGLVGDHVQRPVGSLSPGERTRAVLALLMANGANLLVLDEPTNHLDLPAIEQLEQALDTFGGTFLLVTHDRELLERVRITRTIRLDHGAVV
ncbi:MAG TPA: ABC-F family ATP-binding cassette domain-containing protein [Ilumatobacteraceae bacterium]|nr:ABC-F family ATP-binding cassette domain-containing protein [Ilumatobacteraceae bacterium]